MEIKKGDKFLCIKDVKMAITPEFNNPHTRGKIYTSDEDGYITNNYGGWTSLQYFFRFNGYFKPLKDVDRMYTDATDRLRELHRNFTGWKIGDPDKADYFDNKGINHKDFSFSAQWGLEEFYDEEGYDYVSEEVFIELNGLEKSATKEEQRDYEGYIGRRVIGFKFDSQPNCGYVSDMDDYIGVVGTIVGYSLDYDTFEVKFKDGSWDYPVDLTIKQLEQEDNAMKMPDISDKKDEIVQNNGLKHKETFNPQPHYDNSKGSLYKVATDLGLNHWEFDIFKRLVRCRKKGQFKQDLQKIKDTIDIYIKEYDRDL